MTRLLSIAAALTFSAGTSQGAAQVPVPPVPQRAPDVVFVPTPHKVVDEMLAVARVRPNDILYDLGSGDGRIVIATAKRFGIGATGIDIDPRRITESHLNADSAGVRPGSRVVSHSFGMGDWKADSTLMADTRMVYYWVIPADIAGEWSFRLGTSAGDRELDVTIAQQYQQVTSSEVHGAGRIGFESATIRGDSVRFLWRDAGDTPSTLELTGKVEGDLMHGGYTTDRGITGVWRASRLRRTGLVRTLPVPGERRI